MYHHLPFNCLSEIVEYLEDKRDLRSCLLIDRLWCEVTVPILWTSIQNYHTLIVCLPFCLSDESKEVLRKNNVILSTPNSRPPIFNYVKYVRSLSCDMYEIVEQLGIDLSITSRTLVAVVMREILKMFMKQTSLKQLLYGHQEHFSDIQFLTYPGAVGCLRNLLEFACESDDSTEFLCQLAQICRKIQFLTIRIIYEISDGLAVLVTAQRNLKHLRLITPSSSLGITIRPSRRH